MNLIPLFSSPLPRRFLGKLFVNLVILLVFVCSPLQAGSYTGYDLDGDGNEDYADDDGNIWNNYQDWQDASSLLGDAPDENASGNDPDDSSGQGNPPDNPNQGGGCGNDGVAPANNGNCEPPANGDANAEEITYIPPPPEPPPLPPVEIITQLPPEDPPPPPKKVWKQRLTAGGNDYFNQKVGDLGILSGSTAEVTGVLGADDRWFQVKVGTWAETSTWGGLVFDWDSAISDQLCGMISVDNTNGNLDMLFQNGSSQNVSNSFAQAFAIASVSGAGTHSLSLNFSAGGSNLNTDTMTVNLGGLEGSMSLGTVNFSTGFNTLVWESYEEEL